MTDRPTRVYVLESLSRPGVVKIGMTEYSPCLRASQLEKTSGYKAFAPYRVAFSVEASEAAAVEAEAHRLRQQRVEQLVGQDVSSRQHRKPSAGLQIGVSLARSAVAAELAT